MRGREEVVMDTMAAVAAEVAAALLDPVRVWRPAGCGMHGRCVTAA